MPMVLLNKFKLACFFLAIIQATILASAQAATITVTNAGDTVSNDQACTLREAIKSIHALTTASTGCAHTGLYEIEDTIVFHPGLANQVIELNQEHVLYILKDLSIIGLGADKLTIDGFHNRPEGIFFITQNSGQDRPTVSISNLTILRGERTNGGGAIYLERSVLNLTNSILLKNSASRDGGAILDWGNSSITLINTTVSENSTSSSGGGISVGENGSINLTTSSVSFNTAGINGGGIDLDDDVRLTVDNSTVSSNNATANGGGVYASNGSSVYVDHGTVSYNSAGSSGGGIYADDDSVVTVNLGIVSVNTALESGGGLLSFNSGLEIKNSTISRNNALMAGGGIFFASNDPDLRLLIRQSTVTKNFAFDDGGGISVIGDNSVVKFTQSIVSGNTAADLAADIASFGGTFTADSYNLFGDSSNTNAQAFSGFSPNLSGTDIIATSDGTLPTALTSILDTTLKNNGGQTKTHALVVGSPAINTNSPSFCFPTDQRDVSRNDGKCDIGSYEYSHIVFSDSFE